MRNFEKEKQFCVENVSNANAGALLYIGEKHHEKERKEAET